MILQSVPPLPESSLPIRMIFENPWPLTIAVALISVLAAQQLIARAKARWAAGAFGIGAAIVAALVFIANAVVTDREALRANSVELIDAIVDVANTRGPDPITTAALSGLLSDRIDLISVPMVPATVDAHGFTDLIQRRLRGQTAVQSHLVRETQATTDGPGVGRSHVLVRVTPAATGRPINSSWRLGWQRDAGQNGPWELISIELLELDGWANGMR